MTVSQFERLRQELRALRGDFDQRFDGVSRRFDRVEHRFTGVESQTTKLEIHLEAKPDKAFVVQTLFTINASFLAVIGLAILVSRSLLVAA